MESLIALQGADFVVFAADVASSRSVLVMKDDMDKIHELDPHKVLAAIGVPGDVVKFTEQIQVDVKLNSLRLGIPMSTAAVANFARREMARAVRNNPLQCMTLIGGYDADVGPSLYSCDYLGTLVKLKYGAEGYAQYFVLSTMDRYWKKNMDVEEAIEVIRKCIAEVQQRLVVNQPRFAIKIVGKDGITVVDAADAYNPEKIALAAASQVTST